MRFPGDPFQLRISRRIGVGISSAYPVDVLSGPKNYSLLFEYDTVCFEKILISFDSSLLWGVTVL